MIVYRYLILILSLAQTARLAAEVADGPQVTNIVAGLADAYRVGAHAPVRITLQAGKQPLIGRLVIESNDVDDAPTHWLLPALKLEPDEQRTVEAAIPVGERPWKFSVLWLAENKKEPRLLTEWKATSPQSGYPSTKELYLEVGPSLQLSQVVNAMRAADGARPEILKLTSVGDLPRNVEGYDATAGIILNINHADELQPDTTQISALCRWVERGGRLLLILHQGTNQQISSQSVWQPLLPGTWSGRSHALRQYTLWQSLVRAEQVLQVNEGLIKQPTYVPLLTEPRGRVLLAENNVPLIITGERGWGSITVCLADLNRTPFLNWTDGGRTALLERLFPFAASMHSDSQTNWSNSTIRLGYDDLAGQFRAAMTDFPQQTRLSIWWLFALGGLWTLCWYPLQAWFAEKKIPLFIRWAMLLAGCLLCGAVAWLLTNPTNNKLHGKAIEWIDIDPAGGHVVGAGFAALTTDMPQRCDLTVRTTNQDAQLTLQPFGLPGKGWGGLDAELSTPSFTGAPYQCNSTAGTAAGFTLPRGSAKVWQAEWSVSHPPRKISPLLQRTGVSMPLGTLRYNGRVELRDAMLIYERFAVVLGTLKPGTEISLNTIHSRAVSIGSALTGRRSTGQGSITYDRRNTDLPLLTKLLLFHRSAGGSGFTGLWNRYLADWDRSSSLTPEYAYIVGWGPTTLSWQVADESYDKQKLPTFDEHEAFYRFRLPVRPEELQNSAEQSPIVDFGD